MKSNGASKQILLIKHGVVDMLEKHNDKFAEDKNDMLKIKKLSNLVNYVHSV